MLEGTQVTMNATTRETQGFTNLYVKCPFSTYIVPYFASNGAPKCMCPNLFIASYVPVRSSTLKNVHKLEKLFKYV